MYVGKKITVYYNPVNPWDFHTGNMLPVLISLPLGTVFMLVGGIGIIIIFHRHAAKIALLKTGKKVMAEIADIINSNISVNNNYGKYIVCERRDPLTGTLYRYKSDVIWFNPAVIIEQQNITHLPVFLDQKNEKNYYVDMSGLLDSLRDLT